MVEIDQEVLDNFKKLIIIEDLKYWQSLRKNFSKESEEIIEKVGQGEKLTELDTFILCNDDQNRIEKFRRFYNIKQDIKNNKLKLQDLDFLIDSLEVGDEKVESLLKTKLAPLTIEVQEARNKGIEKR